MNVYPSFKVLLHACLQRSYIWGWYLIECGHPPPSPTLQGHKQVMKKDESDRKKQFYDESDHQEYHIEYDTVDEYFDHHDENDYKGGAKKVSGPTT